MDFHEIWYLSIFRKSVEKSQVSLKSDEAKMWTYQHQYTFLIISRSILLRIRNVLAKVVEKIKTHFIFSNFFFENRVFYEIMLKNIVEQDRPQMTIWHTRIACWIPKATNKHSEFLMRFHCNNNRTKRLNVTLYVRASVVSTSERQAAVCDLISP
jgi:hypothetical protein